MDEQEKIIEYAGKLKQELLNLYYEKVYNSIQPLERVRIYLLISLIFIYSFIFFIIFYLNNFDVNHIIMSIKTLKNYPLIIFQSLMIIIFCVLPIKITSEYYRRRLKKFYPQIIECLGLKYTHSNIVDCIPPYLSDSKLFVDANEIKEDDVFCGEYKGINLRISDMKIIDSGYSHGGTSERKSPVVLYNGIIAIFDSNKQIKSTTLVKPKIDFSIFYKLKGEWLILLFAIFGLLIMISGVNSSIESGYISQGVPTITLGFLFFAAFGYWFVDSSILRELRHYKDLQKLNLEDIDFSKNFHAYSYNQIEGRYLLTTAFIVRFLYLAKVFKTRNLRCSFVNEHLIIAIGARKNEFEIGGLCSSLKNTKHIEKFLEQLIAILLIVDYLKLDIKTGI